MTGIVVITATTGPDVAVTALRIEDCREVNFKLDEGCLYIFKEGERFKQFDLSAVGTVTVSVSAGVYTFTLS